jgi:hypothetical protein
VAAAVTTITGARAESIAAEIVASKARLEALGRELREWTDDAFHTPINSARSVMSATIQTALALTAAPLMDIHRPLNEIRREIFGGSALAARRAELLADDHGGGDSRAA